MGAHVLYACTLRESLQRAMVKETHGSNRHNGKRLWLRRL